MMCGKPCLQKEAERIFDGRIEDHLAVGSEVIGACRNKAVCLFFGHGAVAVLLDLAVVDDIVVVAVDQYKTLVTAG